MNTRKLILVVAAIVGGGAALAQSSEPRTRDEVRAEAIAARQAGEIRDGDTVVLRDLLAAPSSQRSRAEVHAEAVAHVQSRGRFVSYGDFAAMERLRSVSSTLTRAQVRAEAVEAQRLGLIVRGDIEARIPTPAELESVRQAGLRAVGMENMARR